MNEKAILYLMSNEDETEDDYCYDLKNIVKELMFKGFHPYCSQLMWAEFKRNYTVCATSDIVDCKNYSNHIGCPIYFPQPDYVAEDLVYLERWLKHDYNDDVPEIDNPIRLYDSGVVGVVLPSAYHYECSVCKHKFNTFDSYEVDPHVFICGDEASTCDLIWDSNGAKQEYDWMKTHHVLVITLETALTIDPANWGKFAI